MSTPNTLFDPADHLDTPEAVAAYVTEAFESGDLALITDTLGVIARAKGMSQIARESGLARESLYKALGKGGNPGLETTLKVLKTLGLTLNARPLEKRELLDV